MTAQLELVKYNPGEAIMVQGDKGDALYILEEGSAVCSIEGQGIVREFSRGDFFGELALLTGKPRSVRLFHLLTFV